jgi:hypothetical protein
LFVILACSRSSRARKTTLRAKNRHIWPKLDASGAKNTCFRENKGKIAGKKAEEVGACMFYRGPTASAPAAGRYDGRDTLGA